MGKFQELNFIILRLRMNLSYNDRNIPTILHFWVEINFWSANSKTVGVISRIQILESILTQGGTNVS